MASETTPSEVSGGCLCEGVRYKITFPPDHDFGEACATCQCEQCRKNTGSLVYHAHEVPLSTVLFTAEGSLRRYYATTGIARGFCGRCGSFIFWQRESSDRISIGVGTLDKDVLRRHGPLLTAARVHLWCEDAIPGVTDHLEGKRWRRDKDGESAQLMP